MRIPRIYYSGILQPNTAITLNTQASKHLLRVLRLKVGAALIIFNGEGGEYTATLSAINQQQAVISIQNYSDPSVESSIILHLAQALVRSEKMDLIMQKAVELGVGTITPLLTEFGEIKISSEKLQKKLQHWQAIIINACEQSGRIIIPKLALPIAWGDFVSKPPEQPCCLLHNYAEKTFAEIVTKPKAMTLAIGPEGGFSEREVTQARQHDWHIIKLGARTLRTETAGFAAIAAVQTLFGDFV